jgi:membrane protease YdiL (CAAX protease family)
MRSVFLGPNGIRAGWRLLIFALILAAIAVAIFVIVGAGAYLAGYHGVGAELLSERHSGKVAPAGIAFSEGVVLTASLIAVWIMSRIEHRPMGRFGLPLAQAFRSKFWEGALVGFVSISLVLLAVYAVGDFRILGLREAGGALVLDAIEWAGAFVIVGLSEEFLFRGYAQFTVTTGMGFWFAALLTSAAFSFAHTGNHGEGALGIAHVFVFALVFSLVLWRTGNLWFGVGFHFAWDWGQTYFYGAPDSGFVTPQAFLSSRFSGPAWLSGSPTGPEGSIFGIGVLILVAIYAWFRFKGRIVSAP